MPTKTAPRKTAATRALSTVTLASHPTGAALAAPRSRGKSNDAAAPELKSRSVATAAKAARGKAGATQEKEDATRVTRDPEQTRQRILDAAKAEFSRVGLGGARVDRIALEAGANKRMLYYYFGNKEDLFLAVLEYAYEHIRNAEKGLHLDEVDPVEAIRRLVTFTWNYYLEYPEFLNLLNSENLHQARHLKNSGRVRTMHSPFISMIGQILKRGAAAGVFRDDVDPMQLYISIAGLSYFYLGNNYTLSAIFGRDLKAPKAKAERIAHMNEMVLGFLTQQS